MESAEPESLTVNLLTFDWPQREIPFYFSLTGQGIGQRLHRSLFPHRIGTLFPELQKINPDFIYTTFATPAEGFRSLLLDLKEENPDFVKRYFNGLINHYFRSECRLPVVTGFVRETQVWVHSPADSDGQFACYHKYSLKVMLEQVSDGLELMLSYDGRSRVCRRSVVELLQQLSPDCFHRVLCGHRLLEWDHLTEQPGGPDYEHCYAVLNKRLSDALHLPAKWPSWGNGYTGYRERICAFRDRFLLTPAFRQLIELHTGRFSEAGAERIGHVAPGSNRLLFGQSTSEHPFQGLHDLQPYQTSPYTNIHLFYIFHADHRSCVDQIEGYFRKGCHWFKGLYHYTRVLYHTEPGFSICFSHRDDPLPEIEQVLNIRLFRPEVKYIAIYLTPFSQHDSSRQKQEIYFRVKELLLKHRITSQAIDPAKMRQQGQGWVYSLPNLAVAILAKLDGIPWCLDTPLRNEVLVGVGAFCSRDDGVQYIGSAFSFSNIGRFNSFEYFIRDELGLLAGQIAYAVHCFATQHQMPERLVLHYYKGMSHSELQVIEQALQRLDLTIPVFILSINKTESRELVAFDRRRVGMMPLSGTWLRLGKQKYLLFNNGPTDAPMSPTADNYPFPLKISISCNQPALIDNPVIVEELLGQVYSFSRLNWKSVRQQQLPVTIKYPELLARIVSHFDDKGIPPYGRKNLWFL